MAGPLTCTRCSGEYLGKNGPLVGAERVALLCPDCRASSPCAGCGGVKDHEQKYLCRSCRAVPRECPQCGASHHSTRNLCSSCASQPGNAKKRDASYGLASGQYEDMLAAQSGVCAVCAQPERAITRTGKPYGLVVDHCHGSDQVRSLLCRNCNVLIGLAQDDPDVLLAAAAYLIEHSSARFQETGAQSGRPSLAGDAQRETYLKGSE
jgi:hypothetical protein